MSITTAYTLTEAQELLELYKECEKALVSGQAKQYKIGTREFTALDLDEIAAQITRLGNIVEALSGSARTSRVARVIPRDL